MSDDAISSGGDLEDRIRPANEEELESRIRPAEEDELPVAVEIEPDLAEAEETISLVDDPSEATNISKVRQYTRASSVGKIDFKRPLNLTGQGATRCRVFHSRIAIDAMENMEKRINEWLDQNDIEIKHVSQALGIMEGKNPKPNILIVVWY